MDIRTNYINETLKTKEAKERIEWCEKEFGYHMRHAQFGYFHRLYFEDEADMMAYILRWM